jgi:hypothetical protein
MKPAESIERHSETIDYLLKHQREIERVWAGLFESQGHSAGSPRDLFTGHLNGMLQGQTYWVSDEMMAVVHAAARSMPRQNLLATDLPSQCGFCVFEKPLMSIGPNVLRPGATKLNEAPITAVAWGPVSAPSPGTYWIFYSARDAAPVGFPGIFGMAELGKADSGSSTLEDAWPTVLALWTLMGQVMEPKTRRDLERSIGVTEEVTPDRGARRRMMKARRPIDAKTVRVVRLRRMKCDSDAEGGASNYSHRWIVSGHWRNQWMPSLQAHRLQWILPYVKCPDDAPLIVRDTVHALVR